MSRENVEAVWQGFDAFKRGDFDTWLAGFADDVVFIAARSAVVGTFHGHEGVRKFLADNAESFEVFEPKPSEVSDLGDRVLVVGKIRIRTWEGGLETEVPMAGVVTFEGGKITRWEDFRERRLALEALGLPD